MFHMLVFDIIALFLYINLTSALNLHQRDVYRSHSANKLFFPAWPLISETYKTLNELSFDNHHKNLIDDQTITSHPESAYYVTWDNSQDEFTAELRGNQCDKDSCKNDDELVRTLKSEESISPSMQTKNSTHVDLNQLFGPSGSHNELDSSLASNEIDGIEMHTNNHHKPDHGIPSASHHSRANYQMAQVPPVSLSQLLLTNSGYGSYSASNDNNKRPQSSLGLFKDDISLSYIHSLLTSKPSGSLSGLLSSNGLTRGSSPYGLSPSSGYSAAATYYSAPLQLSSSSQSSPSSSSVSLINMHPETSNQQEQHHQSSSSLTAFDLHPASLSSVSSSSSSLASPTLSHMDQIANPPVNEQRLSPSQCGRQQITNREPRIVGGNVTFEGEFPWAVSIQRHGNHHCGGVIVGRRWILTAAHCVRNQLVGSLMVRTGGNTLSRSANHMTSHLERDYVVDQIIMHDDFNLSTSQLMKSSANTNNADIALVRLKHEIHWNDLAWPVCLPNIEAGNFSGHDATVIGWGKLNEKSDDFSNELQKVKLTIIDNKVCQNWFRQAGREMPIDDRILCAGFKNGGKDACHGDSGGPLLSKVNGHYVVVGIVSTGIGCARPLLPGLYSRVSSYASWIGKYVD